MKNTYHICFIVGFLGFHLILFSQGSGLRLITYSNQDVSNSVLTKNIFPDALANFNDFKVVNMGSDAEVMIKRENVNMPSGYTNYFCWGTNCYPSTIDVSTYPEFIPSGQQNVTFIAYIQPNEMGGNWNITYTFFEPGNPSNQVSVTYNGYTYMASQRELPVLNVRTYPNPARDKLIVDLNFNSNRFSVTLTDLTGKIVINHQGAGQQVILDMKDVRKGLYFYHIDVPGFKRLTGKVWVD